MPSLQTTVNVDVDVDIDFEVFCARCGEGLCNQTRTSRNRKYPQVLVEPCQRCLDSAREEGEAKAMEEAEQRLKTL